MCCTAISKTLFRLALTVFTCVCGAEPAMAQGITLKPPTIPLEGSVAFAPDGKILASGSWDHTVKLWDMATGREIHTLSGHTSWVNSVAFAPDGKTLASGSLDYTAKLWDVATGKEIGTLSGHTASVFSVAFAPDGKTLASGSWDHTVKLWDLTIGRK